MNSPQSPIQQSSVYSRQQYATKQFWDSRYKQKQSYFDWYAQFPQLKQTFQKQYSLKYTHSILMLGCGNSKLSQQMYQAGYHNIVNIDISPIVIEQMSKICSEKGYDKMKWLVMDATNMNTIQDKIFDVVIDKGTLDALISGQNLEICEKMLRESMRVLKDDGQIVLVTYGSPQGRKKLFQSSLGFSKYDYYFTRVDLSPMSTLINLMRSNLGNKPLSAITKDHEAMKKSMMEFNLIKVLRRQRKNQKKYIIWSNFTQTPISQHFNQQPQPQQKIPQPQQTLPTQQKTQPHNTQQKPKQLNYSPKKQSFCYVYSIARKFAYNLEQVCTKLVGNYNSSNNVDEVVVIQGDQSLEPIGIYSEQCRPDINKANPTNPITIYPTQTQLINSKQQLKINLKYGQQNTIPILTKSVYEVQIKCSTNGLKQVQEGIEKVCRGLVQYGGLQIHPTPQTYTYLTTIIQKLQSKLKLNQFLKINWYPTYKLISFQQNTAKYHITTPPTLKQQYTTKIINQILLQFKPVTKLIRKGYLHFWDIRLISLVSFCSYNYWDGQCVNLIVDEFINKKNQEYQCTIPTIYLKKIKAPETLARIFSAI